MKTNHSSHRAPLLGGATLLLLLAAPACRRDAPAPEPDPCRTALANPLTFRILENYGTPTPDTAFNKQTITFEAPDSLYTSYAWQIGSDPRTFDKRTVSLYFPDAPPSTLAVRLIARRPPNTRCFSQDDGLDTLTRTLTLVPRRFARPAPIYGRFLGSNADAPQDTFSIRVFQAPPFTTPPDPLAAPYDYLRNLGRGCQSPYFSVGLTWRGIFFNYGRNDFGCLTESGTGHLLASNRDSIVVRYSQNRTDRDPTRVSRVFRGRRVR